MESARRVHVMPLVGGEPVQARERRHVQRLVDEIAVEKSAEAARKALDALSLVLRLAVRDGLIDVNPCASVRVPTDLHGERPPRILTPAECRAIVVAGTRARGPARARLEVAPSASASRR